jgi:hypothetical protein
MTWAEMMKESFAFDDAKRRLDEARSKLASAQTEFITAQERYNEASREYVRHWDEPNRK